MNETLLALVETVMAFDHPDFPAVGADQVARRVLEHFPLDPPLRTTLHAFGALAGFAVVDDQTREAERALLQAEGVSPGAIDGIITGRARLDAQRFEAFRQDHGEERFEQLSLAGRRAYLRLWARSDLSARRRLYTTLKALVLLPAYSLPELRAAIGAP